MINVEKLQREHFVHHDFVLPHYRGYPLRMISAYCAWSEDCYSQPVLNVAVSLPNEAGIDQLKDKLREMNIIPGE